MYDSKAEKNLQEFIQMHRNEDVKQLALQFHNKTDFDLTYALQQINGYQKVQKKLPHWYETDGIIFPPDLNLQQSSSEQTAKYKSSLLTGNSGVDLTGGFGVDSYYLSQNTEKHLYIEPNKELFEISIHNFSVLNAPNIEGIHSDCETWLESLNSNDSFDWLYIDPSRRKEGKQVFLLEDYTPNVVDLQNKLFQHTPHILIKTSPVLDLSNSLNRLQFVKEVHVVAVDNEVKEVLYLLEKNFDQEYEIFCIHLSSKQLPLHEFRFKPSEEQLKCAFGLPEKYLYEPNGAILKAGAFNLTGNKLGLKKLHPNTHLYTSGQFIPDFPGRSFEVEMVLKYEPKKLKKLLGTNKANITVRNFPYSVEQIRKKSGLKDGGEVYLFGATDIDNKPVLLVCKKPNS